MNVGQISFNTLSAVSPWQVSGRPNLSTDTAMPQDGVTLSGASSAAETSSSNEGGSRMSRAARGMFIALALTMGMAGMTGCASNQVQMPSMTAIDNGTQAKSAFESFSFLDQAVSAAGGGIFDGKIKLQPLQAVDKLIDGETVQFKESKDGKAYPIRNNAELQGLQKLLMEKLGIGGVPGALQIPQ
jgi:hypothetical protein